MKLSILIAFLIALPIAANAEVHKYKDANGNWVYSDVAPAPNVKQETIGKKIAQPTGVAPLSKVAEPSPDALGKAQLSKDQAAAKRQQSAEQDKKNKEVKDAQDKEREANCKYAKSNLAAYTQGGRIYKTNEKGERDYLDDKAIDSAKVQAQKDVEENCS